jgi:hypothetical protein
VSYRAQGTYKSSNLAKDPTTGKWSGTTLEIIVANANHHAKTAQAPFAATKGADVTYSITGAHVSVAGEVATNGGPTVGPPADHVVVKGQVTELTRKCLASNPNFAQTVAINRVAVTPPNHKQ